MKKLTTILAALALGSSLSIAADEKKPDAAADKPAAGAAAEKPKRDPAVVFGKLDANSDKSVTLEEFKAGMPKLDAAKAEQQFSKRDANSDGKLSQEEFSAGGGKKAK